MWPQMAYMMCLSCCHLGQLSSISLGGEEGKPSNGFCVTPCTCTVTFNVQTDREALNIAEMCFENKSHTLQYFGKFYDEASYMCNDDNAEWAAWLVLLCLVLWKYSLHTILEMRKGWASLSSTRGISNNCVVKFP